MPVPVALADAADWRRAFADAQGVLQQAERDEAQPGSKAQRAVNIRKVVRLEELLNQLAQATDHFHDGDEREKQVQALADLKAQRDRVELALSSSGNYGASSSSESLPLAVPSVVEPPSSEEDSAELVEHEDAAAPAPAAAEPALRKRAPPTEESAGRGSMMPSVMRAAQEAAASARAFGSDLGAVAGGAAAHELSIAARAPTGTVHSSLSPSSKASAEAAFLKQHNNSVEQGAAAGSVLGGAAGELLGAIFVALTKRLGAHKCDNCSREGMYNYWKCTDAGCAKDQVRLPASTPAVGEFTVLQEGYDLCYSCHAAFVAGKTTLVKHDRSHHFVEHVNGVSAFKLLALVVLMLILARWFLRRLF